MALTAHVARWVSELGSAAEPLPPDVREVVVHAVLDTVACGLFGRDLEWSSSVRRWAARGALPASVSTEGASVWGDATPTLRPSDAAFVNGIAAHAFELDDYHPVKVHPGAVVVPAVLALGEARGVSGATLVRAIAAGYEVMIRTSAALDPSTARLRGWHLTGVTGPLGAAAAASVVLGLDPERTAWALGLAGTQAGGLFAFTADGAMSKRFHAGEAARAGVVAAELSEEGFTGPTAVYEAQDGGYLAAFGDRVNPEALTSRLGHDWQLLKTAFKPYACCGSLHAYVDAAIEAREMMHEDTKIRIGLPRVVEVQCGFDYEEGSVLSAQMNARFCVASALRFGAVLPDAFVPARLRDPETLALMERIEQRHDPALDAIYPANFCGWVEVQAPERPAERFFRRDPSGAAANPAKPRAMREKARHLLGSGENGLADRLEALTFRLETCDASALVRQIIL